MSGHEMLVDRIMVAVLQEPTPTPTRALATAIRRGRVSDATASVWVAWHLATVQRPAIAPGIRARSLALVIAVALSLGSISVVAAATARAIVEQAVLGSDGGRPTLDAQRPALPGDDGMQVVEAPESEAPSSTEQPSPAPAIVEDDSGDEVDRGDDQDDIEAPADDDGGEDRAGGDDEDDAAEPTDGDGSAAEDEAEDDTEAHDDSSTGESDSEDSHEETSSDDSGWDGSSDDD